MMQLLVFRSFDLLKIYLIYLYIKIYLIFGFKSFQQPEFEKYQKSIEKREKDIRKLSERLNAVQDEVVMQADFV